MAVEPYAELRYEPDRPRSSIVIPMRDQMQLTRACLNALLREEHAGVEIIVVDDRSSPLQAAALGAYAPAVRIVRPRDGAGFAAACNAGVAAAQGQNVVLLNNDVLPLPGWLDSLERYAAEHPQRGDRGVAADLAGPHRAVRRRGRRLRRDASPAVRRMAG